MIALRRVTSTALMLSMLIVGVLVGKAAAGAFMAAGDITSQPIGHYGFCKRMPSECKQNSGSTVPLQLNAQSWELIQAVNLVVNGQIEPLSDMEIYGVEEHWAYPDHGVGDCEDFVLEKRRQLHASGIPLTNLLVTVVRKSDGEGHAVLTVRTSAGDLILDNLNDDLRFWTETDYVYLKRQAATHSGRWVSLQGGNNVLVGAVNQ